MHNTETQTEAISAIRNECLKRFLELGKQKDQDSSERLSHKRVDSGLSTEKHAEELLAILKLRLSIPRTQRNDSDYFAYSYTINILVNEIYIGVTSQRGALANRNCEELEKGMRELVALLEIDSKESLSPSTIANAEYHKAVQENIKKMKDYLKQIPVLSRSGVKAPVVNVAKSASPAFASPASGKRKLDAKSSSSRSGKRKVRGSNDGAGSFGANFTFPCSEAGDSAPHSPSSTCVEFWKNLWQGHLEVQESSASGCNLMSDTHYIFSVHEGSSKVMLPIEQLVESTIQEQVYKHINCSPLAVVCAQTDVLLDTQAASFSTLPDDKKIIVRALISLCTKLLESEEKQRVGSVLVFGEWKTTPLSWACFNQHSDLFAPLVSAGAELFDEDLSCRQNQGCVLLAPFYKDKGTITFESAYKTVCELLLQYKRVSDKCEGKTLKLYEHCIRALESKILAGLPGNEQEKIRSLLNTQPRGIKKHSPLPPMLLESLGTTGMEECLHTFFTTFETMLQAIRQDMHPVALEKWLQPFFHNTLRIRYDGAPLPVLPLSTWYQAELVSDAFLMSFWKVYFNREEAVSQKIKDIECLEHVLGNAAKRMPNINTKLIGWLSLRVYFYMRGKNEEQRKDSLKIISGSDTIKEIIKVIPSTSRVLGAIMSPSSKYCTPVILSPWCYQVFVKEYEKDSLLAKEEITTFGIPKYVWSFTKGELMELLSTALTSHYKHSMFKHLTETTLDDLKTACASIIQKVLAQQEWNDDWFSTGAYDTICQTLIDLERQRLKEPEGDATVKQFLTWIRSQKDSDQAITLSIVLKYKLPLGCLFLPKTLLASPKDWLPFLVHGTFFNQKARRNYPSGLKYSLRPFYKQAEGGLSTGELFNYKTDCNSWDNQARYPLAGLLCMNSDVSIFCDTTGQNAAGTTDSFISEDTIIAKAYSCVLTHIPRKHYPCLTQCVFATICTDMLRRLRNTLRSEQKEGFTEDLELYSKDSCEAVKNLSVSDMDALCKTLSFQALTSIFMQLAYTNLSNKMDGVIDVSDSKTEKERVYEACSELLCRYILYVFYSDMESLAIKQRDITFDETSSLLQTQCFEGKVSNARLKVYGCIPKVSVKAYVVESLYEDSLNLELSAGDKEALGKKSYAQIREMLVRYTHGKSESFPTYVIKIVEWVSKLYHCELQCLDEDKKYEKECLALDEEAEKVRTESESSIIAEDLDNALRGYEKQDELEELKYQKKKQEINEKKDALKRELECKKDSIQKAMQDRFYNLFKEAESSEGFTVNHACMSAELLKKHGFPELLTLVPRCIIKSYLLLSPEAPSDSEPHYQAGSSSTHPTIEL